MIKKITFYKRGKPYFSIQKVTMTKCVFEKHGFGVTVCDLSDHWKYLRMMSFQIFFKIGLAILYEFHDEY